MEKTMFDLYAEENLIYSYGIAQATEDGVLVNILDKWPRSLISHVTTNLLTKGYFERDEKLRKEHGEIRWVNLVDLLNQSVQAIKRLVAQGEDQLFVYKVEFPDGQKRDVWAAPNELMRLTVMLPEDY